jgi:acyl carrier protein
MSVRSTITSQFEQVASISRVTLEPLADDLPLRKSGIDSLGIAVLLTRLEDVFGVYAFNADADASIEEEYPVTFGDLVRLYERLASESSAATDSSTRTDSSMRAPSPVLQR